MKGRKLLAALLCIALAVSFVGGCGQNDVKKGEINTAYSIDGDIWPKFSDYYSDTAPREATVTVNGITYTGTYSETTQGNLITPYEYHWYEGENFSFSINSENGEFSLLSLDRTKEEFGECTFDIKQGRKLADAIADDYIILQEYKVTENTTSSHSHYYDYTRVVNGIDTSDGLSISFYCDGSVQFVSLLQIGAFENVKSVDIDEQKAEFAIEKMLRETYAETGHEFSRYTIEDNGLLLVKTAANQCALRYVIVPYYQTDSGREIGSWKDYVLVIVDYKKYNWFKP